MLLEPKYTSTPLLLWHIWWRLCLWGLGAGALLGGVYGALLSPVVLLIEAVTSKENGLGQFFLALPYMALPCFIGLVLGAILGGAAGGLLGLVDGVVIGLVTRIFFVPLTDVRRYRYTTGITGALLNFAGGLAGFTQANCGVRNTTLLGPGNEVAEWVACAGLPAVVAGAYGWWAGGRLARW